MRNTDTGTNRHIVTDTITDTDVSADKDTNTSTNREMVIDIKRHVWVLPGTDIGSYRDGNTATIRGTYTDTGTSRNPAIGMTREPDICMIQKQIHIEIETQIQVHT